MDGWLLWHKNGAKDELSELDLDWFLGLDGDVDLSRNKDKSEHKEEKESNEKRERYC